MTFDLTVLLLIFFFFKKIKILKIPCTFDFLKNPHLIIMRELGELVYEKKISFFKFSCDMIRDQNFATL